MEQGCRLGERVVDAVGIDKRFGPVAEEDVADESEADGRCIRLGRHDANHIDK